MALNLCVNARELDIAGQYDPNLTLHTLKFSKKLANPEHSTKHEGQIYLFS
jgi:hypothetical protein